MTDKDYPTIGEIRSVEDLPLIVTHPEPVTRVTVEVEQTCRTCKWWEGQAPKDEWASCGLVDEAYAPMGIAAGSCDERPTFDTQFDFGCNQWQQRGGE